MAGDDPLPMADAPPDCRDLNLFDPYSNAVLQTQTRQQGSLLDTDDDEETIEFSTIHLQPSVPGAAGFLEMEDEPPRTPERESTTRLASPSNRSQSPIQTKSGLLLTHRRTPMEAVVSRSNTRTNIRNEPFADDPTSKKRSKAHRTRGVDGMEYEHAYYSGRSSNGVDSSMLVLKRLLGYVQVWVVLSAVVIALGTAIVVVHHLRQPNSNSSSNNLQSATDYSSLSSSMVRIVAMDEAQMQMLDRRQQQQQQSLQIPDAATVILRPLPLQDEHRHATRHLHQRQQADKRHKHRRLSHEHGHLWSHFKDWALRHNKSYHSQKEMTKRFGIWVDNHHKTVAKNERHGPCQLTGQAVFGSTPFSDLTQEEFQSQYLNAYNVTRKLQNERPAPVMGQHDATNGHAPNHHPDIRRLIQERRSLGQSNTIYGSNKRQASYQDCDLYDISCYLRYFFETYVYGYGGTMEPAYDANSYPMAWDWREYGVVTDVHSQGNCGACWAITATETVESAVALATGVLNDLSEHEVIVCAEECQMCSGGWPQDAIDYVMDNGGVPLESDLKYNADLLLTLTKALEGESDEVDDNYLKSYRQEICPSGGGNSHSNDGASSGGTSYKRYGSEIKGYGYATDRCVCYTDGSGCNCDSQNEGLAVRNLATYGPAIVCVDASLWQDYTGGIITSDSGCSSGFMDVNHCVQAVGYAYTTGGNGDEDEKGGSGDGGHSKDDGESKRIGYWIIRNQWSTYFGMSGYAYVAMGDNTCGILNDMIQIYT